MGVGVGQHVCLIDQDARQMPVRLEDGPEQRSVAAAHVDDRAHGRPVVGCLDGRVLVSPQLAQGGIENPLCFRARAQVVPERGAVCVLPRGLAGAKRVADVGELAPYVVGAEVEDEVAHAVRPLAQEVRSRRVGEDAGLDLGEEAVAGEHAQHPLGRQRVQPCARGEVVRRERPIREEVRDAVTDERPERLAEIQGEHGVEHRTPVHGPTVVSHRAAPARQS